jgi:hypothetical protein
VRQQWKTDKFLLRLEQHHNSLMHRGMKVKKSFRKDTKMNVQASRKSRSSASDAQSRSDTIIAVAAGMIGTLAVVVAASTLFNHHHKTQQVESKQHVPASTLPSVSAQARMDVHGSVTDKLSPGASNEIQEYVPVSAHFDAQLKTFAHPHDGQIIYVANGKLPVTITSIQSGGESSGETLHDLSITVDTTECVVYQKRPCGKYMIRSQHCSQNLKNVKSSTGINIAHKLSFGPVSIETGQPFDLWLECKIDLSTCQPCVMQHSIGARTIA